MLKDLDKAIMYRSLTEVGSKQITDDLKVETKRASIHVVSSAQYIFSFIVSNFSYGSDNIGSMHRFAPHTMQYSSDSE